MQHETTQEANVAGDVLHNSLILTLFNTSDYWLVDSRDSCHATSHRKFFHNYVPGDFGHFYQKMMNHVKLLEWVKYKLS